MIKFLKYGSDRARNAEAENSLNEILVFLDSNVITEKNFIPELRKIGRNEI